MSLILSSEPTSEEKDAFPMEHGSHPGSSPPGPTAAKLETCMYALAFTIQRMCAAEQILTKVPTHAFCTIFGSADFQVGLSHSPWFSSSTPVSLPALWPALFPALFMQA